MIELTHKRLSAKCQKIWNILQGLNKSRNWHGYYQPYRPIKLGSAKEYEIGVRSGIEFRVFEPETDQDREMIINISGMVDYIRANGWVWNEQT